MTTPTARADTGSRGRSIASRFASTAVVVVILAALLVFFVLPAVWLLLAPSKTAGQMVHDLPLSFGSFSQVGAAWDHLVSFQDGALFRWLGNSALYSLGSLVLTLAVSVPAGYALALSEFRGRKLLLTITLIVMIMPSAALVLPIFLELNLFGLIGTAWSIILPFSFYPFGVYLVYIYFATTLPRDLLAAARMDGCTEWQVFKLVAIPLARPVIGLVAFSARRKLEQLLPAVSGAAEQRSVPDPGGPEPTVVLDAVLQPGRGRGTQHHQPRTRAGDHHLDSSRARAVPVLSTRARVGNAGRIHKGIGPRVQAPGVGGSCRISVGSSG